MSIILLSKIYQFIEKKTTYANPWNSGIPLMDQEKSLSNNMYACSKKGVILELVLNMYNK